MTFKDISTNFAQTVGSTLGGLVQGLARGTGADAFFSGLSGTTSLSGLDGTARLQAMYERQLAMQEQHEMFTMQTNLARTEHESRMNAIRNLRA